MLLGYSFAFHAVLSAYMSLSVGIVEATITILAGRTDVSMSLYAVALMSILDAVGSILVLTLWQNRKEESSFADKFEKIEASESEEITDLWYSFTIGFSMLVMGLFLIIVSVKALFDEDITASTDKDMGMITTAIGFSLSFFLALYKFEIGHKLQSQTITADATSSLCSGLTSLSALVVTFLDPYFWWADSGTGGLVALYTLYKGTSTMIHSMNAMGELKDERKRRIYFCTQGTGMESSNSEKYDEISYQRNGVRYANVVDLVEAESDSLLFGDGI